MATAVVPSREEVRRSSKNREIFLTSDEHRRRSLAKTKYGLVTPGSAADADFYMHTGTTPDTSGQRLYNTVRRISKGIINLYVLTI